MMSLKSALGFDLRVTKNDSIDQNCIISAKNIWDGSMPVIISLDELPLTTYHVNLFHHLSQFGNHVQDL